MITIYDKNATSFHTDGLGVLIDFVHEPEVTERHGYLECKFTYLLSGQHAQYVAQGYHVKMAPNDRQAPLPFTIYEAEPDYVAETIEVLARVKIANDIHNRSIPYMKFENVPLNTVLNQLKNSMRTAIDYRQTTDVTVTISAEFEEMNAYEALISHEQSVLNRSGAQLIFYENGLSFQQVRGRKKVAIIRKESALLKKMAIRYNRDSLVTCIIPYTTLMNDSVVDGEHGRERKTTEQKVYGTPVISPNIQRYGLPEVTRYVEYRNESVSKREEQGDKDRKIELNNYKYQTTADLDQAASRFFVENAGIDSEKIVADLEMYGFYDAELTNFGLYDTIEFYSAKYDVDIELKVAETVYQPLTNRVVKVVFEQDVLTIQQAQNSLNDGKVSGSKLSERIQQENVKYNQHNQMINFIDKLDGTRLNFVSELPNPEDSSEGDIVFLDKGDKGEIWEFKEGAWHRKLSSELDEEINQRLSALDTQLSEANLNLQAQGAHLGSIMGDLGVAQDLAQEGKNIAENALNNALQLSTKVLETGEKVKQIELDYDELEGKLNLKLTSAQLEDKLNEKGYITLTTLQQSEGRSAESLRREITKVERKLNNDYTSKIEFNRVKETAQLYERIIGKTEADATTNISRMLRSSELFMSEITTGGRRNLYTGTKNFDGSDWGTPIDWQATLKWSESTTKYKGCKVLYTKHVHNGLWQNVEVKKGDTITFTAIVYSQTAMKVHILGKWDNAPFPATSPKAGLDKLSEMHNVPVGAWTKVSTTFTVISDGSMQPRIEKRASDNEPDKTLFITQIMVEKGENPTKEWSESTDEPVSSRIAQTQRLLELGLFGQEGILDGILIGRDTINIKSKLINLDGDVRMNNAFVTKLITQHLDTNTLRAMVANINQLNAIQVNANNITTGTMTGINLRGGVLSALNGATQLNLNTGELQFFTDNAAMRRVVSGHPNQFVQFGFDDVYSNDGSQIVRTASTAIGSNRGTNNFTVDSHFAGIRIFNRSQNPYVDRIQYIGDLHEFTHTGNKHDFQNNIWAKSGGSKSDWAQLYPSFSGNRGNSSLGTWTQPWGTIFVEEIYIVSRDGSGNITNRRKLYL